jgi:hypothetical protein
VLEVRRGRTAIAMTATESDIDELRDRLKFSKWEFAELSRLARHSDYPYARVERDRKRQQIAELTLEIEQMERNLK